MPTLEYDRTPTHVTRGQFRIFLILLFINTIAVVSYLCVPEGSKWLKDAWKQWEARRAAKESAAKREAAMKLRADALKAAMPTLNAYSIPSDDPVYTDDPIEAATLLASGTAYQTVSSNDRIDIPWQPSVLRAKTAELGPLSFFNQNYARDNRSVAPIFVHLRRNPRGQERLVNCQLMAAHDLHRESGDSAVVKTRRSIRVQLLAIGGDPAVRTLHQVETTFDQSDADRATFYRKKEPKTPQVLRLFAGQPDPTDPTRFSIPYFLNGIRGSFNGRILEGDRLSVEPSDGRIVERQGDELIMQVWDPSQTPAVPLNQAKSLP